MLASTVYEAPNLPIMQLLTVQVVRVRLVITVRWEHLILRVVLLERTCLSPDNLNVSRAWKDIIARLIRLTTHRIRVQKVISARTTRNQLNNIRVQAELSVTQPTDNKRVIVLHVYPDIIVHKTEWQNRLGFAHPDSSVSEVQKAVCLWSMIISLLAIACVLQIRQVGLQFFLKHFLFSNTSTGCNKKQEPPPWLILIG